MTTDWPEDDWVHPRSVALTDGTRLAVRLLPGDQAPVLLAHGLASNALLWRAVAERINADGSSVAVVDLRGHGRSDRPPHGHSTGQAALDLGEVAAGLGWTLSDVTLAGQSWGGNVALRAAATGAWAGALAVDGGWIHLGARYDTFEACWAELAPPSFSSVPPEVVTQQISAMVSDWPPGALGAILGNLEIVHGRVRNRLDRKHHREILRSLWADDPAACYSAISAPVHFVVAGCSSSTEVERAVSALSDATVSWHPDAHHDIHLQHPDVVAGHLRELLRRVQGSLS